MSDSVLDWSVDSFTREMEVRETYYISEIKLIDFSFFVMVYLIDRVSIQSASLLVSSMFASVH